MERDKYVAFTIGQAIMLAMGEWSIAQGITGQEPEFKIDGAGWKDLQVRLEKALAQTVLGLLTDPLAVPLKNPVLKEPK